MGKVKTGIYGYLIVKILTKEMFVDWSCTKHILFTKPLKLIGCQGNQKAKFLKNILKNQLLKSYLGDKAETLQKSSKHEPLKHNCSLSLLHEYFGHYGNLKIP